MARGFDLLAPVYDLLAGLAFGKSIRRAQFAHLGEISAGSRVLVLGGGTGWFLEELLKVTQPSEVVYVDISAKMISLSKERIARKCPDQMGKVQFVQGELWAIDPGERFEVVVTHFYLDLFPEKELQRIMERIQAILSAEGKWLFADFQVVSRGGMRFYSALIIRVMYAFFRVICRIPASRLPDFSAAFSRLGFVSEKENFFFAGMISSKIFSQQKKKSLL
ncbi:MAG: class I SAM-dependent methyltransferase [Bacteroidia bacterium]|nr:class I SAM-dependent methyltransferase [Bacteroidia bacterium]